RPNTFFGLLLRWEILHFSIECFSSFAPLASTTVVTLRILGHRVLSILHQKESLSSFFTKAILSLSHSPLGNFTSQLKLRSFLAIFQLTFRLFLCNRSNYTQHLDRMLEEAAAEFYPNIKFMRVECPKYPGFCITRQKSEYPFIEIFHSPQQAGNEGKVQDPNVTRYSVKVVPYNYDMSPYGFREFFKRQGVRTSDPK
ncbi:hypothetical protein HID58_088107, partial [Brassica napus]